MLKTLTTQAKLYLVLGLIICVALGLLFWFLTKPKPKIVGENNQSQAVASAGVSAVSVVGANQSAAASIDQQVNTGVQHVKSQKNAGDSGGDAGSAGLDALCGMHNYADDPACRLRRTGSEGVGN